MLVELLSMYSSTGVQVYIKQVQGEIMYRLISCIGRSNAKTLPLAV